LRISAFFSYVGQFQRGEHAHERLPLQALLGQQRVLALLAPLTRP
jgi:hypothetical protein